MAGVLAPHSPISWVARLLAVSRAPRLDAMRWAYGAREVAPAWGGGRRARIEAGGLAFDLFLAAPAERPTALFHLTGPRAFNIRTRAAAKRRGWRLNQYGLWDARTGARVAEFATERDVFAALGVTPAADPRDLVEMVWAFATAFDGAAASLARRMGWK